jgi:CheY-like chemotaxis protein
LARKILLADDSVTAQNMGRKILSDAGYDVLTVNNGSAALKRVAEQKPDLIVLDIYMPGYSGLEVCQRLKDSPETERIPVLLTVGKMEPFKPDEARRVRADAYIIKPFEASELLSALARMEDRIVPEQGETDTGWKSRLRFPSKKKKEEPEPEPEMDVAVGPGFRNFRREKSKASSIPAEETAPAPLEASVVPDIPHDITPEELDALTALAAKLDAPAAETEEKAAPAVEKAVPVEAKAECEATAPAREDTGEVPAVRVEPHGERETLATNAISEASAGVNAAEAVAVSEVKPAETVHVETLAADPAPVDRDDEPLFASAASAVDPAPQEEKTEEKQVPAASSEAAAAANPSETTTIQATAEEQKDEPRVEVTPQVVETVEVEEAAAEAAPKIEGTPKLEEMGEAVRVVAAAPEPEAGLAPSEEELAEALRLLTPALGHTDPSSIPTRETLVAAGGVLAEQAARNASEAPRWEAAAVEVSPEEAALSLETEMFRTLARTSVDDSVPAAALSPAVESEAAAVEVKAEIFEEVPADTVAAVAAMACEAVALRVEAVLAEQQDSPTTYPQTQAADEAAEEPAPATFADAVQRDEVEVVSPPSGTAPASDAAVPAEEVEPPAVVETMEVPTSAAAAEGEEAMAKGRAKAGKSKWHQIRTGTTAGAASNDVEAAKQAAMAVEEAPKAMAAAAAAESAPALPDSNTIASIVDSVLADLRPRIVEEIAKKLAGK